MESSTRRTRASASSPTSSPTCARSSSSARSSRRIRSSASSSERRDCTLARSSSIACRCDASCSSTRCRRGAIVGLHALEHVPRRRVAPRIERGEPTFVPATLVEQRRHFVQRAVRIASSGIPRAACDSAATSLALNSFTLPSVRAASNDLRGVFETFHALVRDVERRAERRGAVVRHQKRVMIVEYSSKLSANASVPGVTYGTSGTAPICKITSGRTGAIERLTGHREARRDRWMRVDDRAHIRTTVDRSADAYASSVDGRAVALEHSSRRDRRSTRSSRRRRRPSTRPRA